jgi:hypothetical protein
VSVVVLVESHQAAMKHLHLIVQLVVLMDMQEALSHHLVVLVLLATRMALLMVAVAMNHIYRNKHSLNRMRFLSFSYRINKQTNISEK